MNNLFSFLKRCASVDKFLLFTVFFFMIFAINLYGEFVPDDTFIHIGYAKDISEGRGYSFTGNRTYGSTSPLWPLLIAALAFVHVNLEYAARLLSLFFSIASIVLLYSVARLRFGVAVSRSIACLLCFNAFFLRWSLTGMEASAACFFMLMLIYLLHLEKCGSGSSSFFYLFIGVSLLVRPEFYLFISLFFLFLFFSEPGKKYTVKILLTSIPVVLWNCFAFIYYSTIVPSTFSIKAGDTFFSTEWNTLIRSVRLFLSGNSVEFCIILFAASLWVLHAKRTWRKKIHDILRSEYFLIVLWIILFYAYYVLKNVTVISRYALVLLPPLLFLMAALFNRACEQSHCSPRTTNLLLVIVVVLSMSVHGLFTLYVVKPDADSFVHGFQREYKKIALLLAEDGCKNGSVALSDVGMIGVYSGLKICDFVGLVDSDRHRFLNNCDYFKYKKPQYLISRGEVTVKELQDTSASFQPMYSAQIAGLGINKKEDLIVQVYKVSWK